MMPKGTDANMKIGLIIEIAQNERGEIYLDTLLVGEDQLLVLFSFARAYFFVDMEVPAAYISFLRLLMPRKPRTELYMAVGLAKQGKTLFYRDLHYHLKHSTDKFVVAPGIKGMVMMVFDLPSFPFVFKVIKDRFDLSSPVVLPDQQPVDTGPDVPQIFPARGGDRRH